MIQENIDQGWGPEHPLKQMEIEIVDRYLTPFRQDNKCCVVINSTWFDGDLNRRLQQKFAQSSPDRIVLVSMLDAAIAQPHMFDYVGCEVRAVGYYAGPDWIDYWSLVVDRHMRLPGINLLDEQLIDTAFMCLNRKPHWHRLQLYKDLESLRLLDQGLISLGGNDGQAVRLLSVDSGGSDLAPNGSADQNGIANDIVSLGHGRNWQRHFLNVVTETQYDVSGTTFVTEKIYKPILGMRPFLVYAADGAKDWLLAHGFQSFINDFRDITDLALDQPANLAPFLQTLVQQGPRYWRKKIIDLRDKISYNRSQFDRHVASQHTKIERGIDA